MYTHTSLLGTIGCLCNSFRFIKGPTNDAAYAYALREPLLLKFNCAWECFRPDTILTFCATRVGRPNSYFSFTFPSPS